MLFLVERYVKIFKNVLMVENLHIRKESLVHLILGLVPDFTGNIGAWQFNGFGYFLLGNGEIGNDTNCLMMFTIFTNHNNRLSIVVSEIFVHFLISLFVGNGFPSEFL